MGKHKKKRNKKYSPPEGTIPTQPVIHRYVAEQEQKRGRFKLWRRWAIIAGAASLLLLLVVWLVF